MFTVSFDTDTYCLLSEDTKAKENNIDTDRIILINF